MTLYIHLRVVGAMLMLLGLSHVFFDRYFGWRKELGSVSLLTRKIFFVHTFFIGLGVMMAGAVSFLCAAALLEPSALSRAILAGMAVFWLCRLLAQWFAYDAAIWRGNRFRTFMHVVFSTLWIYVTATYGSALVRVWTRF
jgi:hypothetical protein